MVDSNLVGVAVAVAAVVGSNLVAAVVAAAGSTLAAVAVVAAVGSTLAAAVAVVGLIELALVGEGGLFLVPALVVHYRSKAYVPGQPALVE